MLALLEPRVEVSRSNGGGVVLRSTTSLGAHARCVGDWLAHWASQRPDATFLAERDAGPGADGWRRLTYAEALRRVEGVASALLERGGRADRPVMILSDNGIEAATIALAAMHAGIPAAPISPAYSLLSKTFHRLRAVAEQLGAGFVFADDPARFEAAIAAIHATGSAPAVLGSADVKALGESPRSSALEAAHARVGAETIAKILFTSGSTGAPKGVVNTQRMLTSNQESLAACWPFLQEQARPPVVVDWLPWSHTFGGNHNFFLVLRNGGSLYIDRGRPAPGLIETTIQNLADVAPTLWFNVPRGFDQAAPILEADEASAARIFSRLDLVFYAAAALSPQTRERLEGVAARAGRRDVFFTSAWGSTETSPLATSAHFTTRTTGILGLPVPGVELGLVPVQDRFELRVRGPNVTPGMWQPGGAIVPIELDDAGFLPTGDAGRLADDAHPEQGVVFVGRLSENFKLSTGTWVNVAQVRLGLVDACTPAVLDAVIAGHDREALGALAFPSPAGKALGAAALRARIREGLAAYNAAHRASSERIARVLVESEPLSLDEGETTDKGYTNQRRVLDRRAASVVALLTGDERDPRIVGAE